jgi:hypothetical protein
MLNDRIDAMSQGDLARERTTPAARPETETFADREVPLTGVRPVLAVQQWLDGEASEAVAQAASPADVALWKALGAGFQAKGDRRAPAGLVERIAAALPAAPTPGGLVDAAPRAD